MRGFDCSLSGPVVIGRIVGILLGRRHPDVAAALKPLGDGSIQLLEKALDAAALSHIAPRRTI